jgi:hypothetical protein
MTLCHIDHITITAPQLAVGVAFLRQSLGVSPQAGGEHARMGTHNFLLRLGDSLFLEVIAPNPDAPKPTRPRWFELDDLQSDTRPKLATWVARTSDIYSTVAACSEPLGDVEPMSRGELTWLITIPRDGSLPFAGIAPTLIEWSTEPHVATKLQDVGCSLVGLEAFHPEAAKITALLKSMSFEGDVSVAPLPSGEKPYLVAHIDTPSGLRQLGAH